jgi:hypothetical protein
LAYTTSVIKGKSIKILGKQKYIARLNEARRTSNRHSNFWIGIYGNLWVIAWEFLIDIVQDMMKINSHKLADYQSGLRVINLIQTA